MKAKTKQKGVTLVSLPTLGRNLNLVEIQERHFGMMTLNVIMLNVSCHILKTQVYNSACEM